MYEAFEEEYLAKDDYYQHEMYINEYGVLCQSITEDIQRGVYDMCFENIHQVAKYMYLKLGRKTTEALVLELEAQLRFS